MRKYVIALVLFCTGSIAESKEYWLYVKSVNGSGVAAFSKSQNFIESIDPEGRIVCEDFAEDNYFICEVDCESSGGWRKARIIFEARPQYIVTGGRRHITVFSDYCDSNVETTHGMIEYKHAKVALADMELDLRRLGGPAAEQFSIADTLQPGLVQPSDGSFSLTGDQVEAANRLQKAYADIAAVPDLADDLGISRAVAQDNSATITTMLYWTRFSADMDGDATVLSPGVTGFFSFQQKLKASCGSDCGPAAGDLVLEAETIGSDVRQDAYRAAQGATMMR